MIGFCNWRREKGEGNMMIYDIRHGVLGRVYCHFFIGGKIN